MNEEHPWCMFTIGGRWFIGRVRLDGVYFDEVREVLSGWEDVIHSQTKRTGMVSRFGIVSVPPFNGGITMKAPDAGVVLLGLDAELHPSIRTALDRCVQIEEAVTAKNRIVTT